MDDALERLRRDYRPAFLSHVGHPTEAGLHRAGELGRQALAQGVGLLDLVEVHHDVLLDVLRTATREEIPHVLPAAAGFLVEALGPAEMAQRGFLERLHAVASAPDPARGGRHRRPRA